MNEISIPRRMFFGVIALAASLVAYLGILFPQRLDESFTWVVLPPLHARFVGVLYLFGAVYMIGCILARRWSQVSPALPGIGIFTILLLLVTLLNLEAFDFDLVPVWVWTLSYIVYPAIAFALAWTARDRRGRVPPGRPSAPWVPTFLTVQAGVFAVLGLVLLVAPSAMVDVWPWKISAGLAQFYAGPFLAYAFCSWRYSRRGTWADLAAIAPGMLVFTGGTVVVSLVHRELFSASDPSTWAWFVVFGAAAVCSLAISARAVPAGAQR